MICPKCEQPLENGDESYICCAKATLQWRCLQCAKVSEGFAMPYGLCPCCGGKLERVEPRQIDDGAELEGLRKAFEIELGGHIFYLRAAEESADPVLKDLCGRFAEMEREHMLTLQRRYHAKIPVSSAEFRFKTASVFAGVSLCPANPANLFSMAVRIEERAAEYFEQCAQETKTESAAYQLYRELAAEEREHVALLSTEYAALLSAKYARGKENWRLTESKLISWAGSLCAFSASLSLPERENTLPQPLSAGAVERA